MILGVLNTEKWTKLVDDQNKIAIFVSNELSKSDIRKEAASFLGIKEEDIKKVNVMSRGSRKVAVLSFSKNVSAADFAVKLKMV